VTVTGLLIAVGALTVAAGAYVRLVKSRRRKAARRAVWGIPATAIVAVKDGETVRITGRAVARAPLRTSPISRRGCIGFCLTVDRHQSGSESWQRVVDKEEFDSFSLVDETGAAMLHAPFEMKLDPYDARAENLPPALFEVLEREGVAIKSMFGSEHEFRYVETILVPGEEITAVGRATIEIDPAGRSPSHREPPAMCHMKGLEEAVIIADAEELRA